MHGSTSARRCAVCPTVLNSVEHSVHSPLARGSIGREHAEHATPMCSTTVLRMSSASMCTGLSRHACSCPPLYSLGLTVTYPINVNSSQLSIDGQHRSLRRTVKTLRIVVAACLPAHRSEHARAPRCVPSHRCQQSSMVGGTVMPDEQQVYPRSRERDIHSRDVHHPCSRERDIHTRTPLCASSCRSSTHGGTPLCASSCRFPHTEGHLSAQSRSISPTHGGTPVCAEELLSPTHGGTPVCAEQCRHVHHLGIPCCACRHTTLGYPKGNSVSLFTFCQ